ncbi:DUF2523 domain-containing protein [Acinetobacter baumannii]|uniref:DUF2523 domain-containing protein n=1 Tax=Acinetobacter pittii TaxID=48296 RepID=A0AB33BD65_ACIPI|nr:MULTISPECIES: DUF2523 family protein [Acinetobacter calcoaceticus/baumannii complex]AMX18662.1 hypothetical protein IEC338SC_1520 [Acinetobacter pittii]EGY5283666.1 DUF2523 domain-containing protein [Acinetobacter baumannii]EIB6746606.1 DUF2523 domain-containing protein [Acinetobacter baumannii]EKT9427077.1 DUF2523 domain-containing protein [Acinetobacter baumannii]EKU3799766.1 DUF2523 domain-containing protein [Acinetobacter baumannii]
MSSLATLFSSLQKGFLKNVLTGAGITLATSGTLLLALNTAVTTFKNTLGGIPVTVLNLAGLAGFDYTFSIILGAIVTRYIQNSSKLTLRKI